MHSRLLLSALILASAQMLSADVSAAKPAPKPPRFRCTNVVPSLPYIITTPGNWCLSQDLSYAGASTSALQISASNVVLDCKGFMLNGTPAGASTQAAGIYSYSYSNVAVRHCVISGFFYGLNINNAGLVTPGIAVEDNTFEGNTFVGIQIAADGAVMRRNNVFNTGGSSISTVAQGIATHGTVEITGNNVIGVFAAPGSNDNAFGIYAGTNPHYRISGNTVRDLRPDGAGWVGGIYIDGTNGQPVSADNNTIVGLSGLKGWGFYCGAADVTLTNSTITGFQMPVTNCTVGAGNVITP